MKATNRLKKEISEFAEYLKTNNSFYRSIYEGKLDIQTLSVFTANVHYLVQHTPVHLFAAADTSKRMQMKEHQKFFEEKIKEEEGHDIWAEDDLKIQRDLGAKESSTGILSSMKALTDFNASNIAKDPDLYLPYILLAEYFTVIATPSMLEALEQKNNIPKEALSVLGNHAELDKHHIDEWEEEVSVFVDIEKNEEKYMKVIKAANKIYDQFCNECVEAARGQNAA